MGGINYLFPPDQIENLPSWRFILHFRETGSSDAERLQTASELLKSAEFQIAHFPSGLGLKVNQDTRSIDIRVEVPEERRKKSDSLSLYESDVWKILGNMASCGYEEVYYEAVDWKETELPTKKWWQFWK